MNIKLEDKQKLIGILTVLFPTATIYLFGSCARGIRTVGLSINLNPRMIDIVDISPKNNLC